MNTTTVSQHSDGFILTLLKTEPRIDSRLLAKSLRNKHKTAMFALSAATLGLEAV